MSLAPVGTVRKKAPIASSAFSESIRKWRRPSIGSDLRTIMPFFSS